MKKIIVTLCGSLALTLTAMAAGPKPTWGEHGMALFGGQSGFSGATVVAAGRCEWHPEIAFPAVGAGLDAGFMRFDTPDNLHETGIDGSYDEDWVRVAT
jgi:hypothetical protein